MRWMAFLVVCALTVLLGVGCGGVPHKNHEAQTLVTGEVFLEASGGAIPAGFGDIVIRSTIKTRPERFYPMDSRSLHQGSDHYPFVISIGKQTVTWYVKGVPDDTPKYDPDGRTLKDPEAGPGVRYLLDKALRLKTGIYDVRVELPDEKVNSVAKVTVEEGKSVVVDFRPIYRLTDHPYFHPSYLKGVSTLEIYIDSKKQ